MFICAIILAYTSHAQTDCEPATITKVEREGVGNRINWTLPPSGEEVTISQGNDCPYYYYIGIGVGFWNETKSAGAYHRFTPEHLAAINGGELTQVVFVPAYSHDHQQKPGHTHTIQIYKGGTWGAVGNRNPGTLIFSQELDNDDLVFFQENTITLTTPVPIDASQEMWLGYYCTDIDTIPGTKGIAGIDNGPRNEGFGNIMIYDNQWMTNYEYNQAAYNFVIKGIVQTIDSATVNIFFNGNELVTNFLGITYFHDNPTGEEHCYKVEVNCLEGGVSLFSNEKCIPGVGVKENGEVARFTVYPNPANNELRITNYELRNGVIEIYDVFGRLQKGERIKEKGEGTTIIDISHLSAGVYFIRLTDEKSSAVQKFIKE